MIRYLLLLAFIGLSTLASLAESPKYKSKEDSVRTLLKTNLQDTMRVNLLIALARKVFERGEFEEAAGLLQQADETAKKSGEMKSILKVLSTRGTMHFYKGDYITAEKIWMEGKQKAEEFKNDASIDEFEGLLANVYMMQNNYIRALDIYLKLLKKAEARGDEYDQLIYNGNIGTMYVNMNEPAKALPYLKSARVLIEKFKNDDFLGNILVTESVANKKLKNYSEAEKLLQQTLRLAEKNKSTYLLHNARTLETEILIDQLKFHEALPLVERNISEFGNETGSLDKIGGYGQKAQIFYKLIAANDQQFLNTYFKGNKDAAMRATINILDTAIRMNMESGVVVSMEEWYKIRSNIKRMQGDYKGALEDFMTYKSLNDSVYNTERNNEMTQKTMMYEFEKKETAMKEEQLRKDIRSRNIRNSIAAGLLFSMVFGIIVYRQRNKISKEKKRSEELLLNILPEEVAQELKEKGNAEAKMIDQVSVLFTDFKGFTALSESLTPTQLVEGINECFSEFDHIMQRHGVEKIKTIGDSYMAAGGLPVANTTHGLDVVNAALEIQEFMRLHKEKKQAEGKPFFEIRIGIHSGPVVAGIVGIKKFSYDIWGDTVNTASRIESSGEVGKVNISESTYTLVKDQFKCTSRGKIQVKGKGEIEMYFVEG